MTVNPGFGGQTFIHSVIEKVAAAHVLIGSRPIHLEVDGGITSQTAALVTAAGANVLVAGSAVYRGVPAEYATNIRLIREAAETGRMQTKTTGIPIMQDPAGSTC
jgi:ribulose-phosphate 3-epimerase